MKKNVLFMVWAALFILCAGLGFVTEPGSLMKAVMVMLAAGFFVPPALILKKGQREEVLLVRNFSVASLALTLVLLVANIMSVQNAQAVGDVLFWILTVVSAPMVCSQYWAVSMFGWACLMIVAWKKCRKA